MANSVSKVWQGVSPPTAEGRHANEGGYGCMQIQLHHPSYTNPNHNPAIHLLLLTIVFSISIMTTKYTEPQMIVLSMCINLIVDFYVKLNLQKIGFINKSTIKSRLLTYLINTTYLLPVS